jgi:hypothetical protein
VIPKPKAKKKAPPKRKQKSRLTKQGKNTVTLDKHTPVKKSVNKKPVSVSEFHPVPKPGTRNGIKQVSHKQAQRERNLQKLKHYLVKVRANGVCEICGSSYHLQAAHIVERSTGGRDNAGNLVIACQVCHDHQQYAHGLPLNPEEARLLIDEKNREKGIDRFITGDLVPREEIETWVD